MEVLGAGCDDLEEVTVDDLSCEDALGAGEEEDLVAGGEEGCGGKAKGAEVEEGEGGGVEEEAGDVLARDERRGSIPGP